MELSVSASLVPHGKSHSQQKRNARKHSVTVCGSPRARLNKACSAAQLQQHVWLQQPHSARHHDGFGGRCGEPDCEQALPLLEDQSLPPLEEQASTSVDAPAQWERQEHERVKAHAAQFGATSAQRSGPPRRSNNILPPDLWGHIFALLTCSGVVTSGQFRQQLDDEESAHDQRTRALFAPSAAQRRDGMQQVHAEGAYDSSTDVASVACVCTQFRQFMRSLPRHLALVPSMPVTASKPPPEHLPGGTLPPSELQYMQMPELRTLMARELPSKTVQYISRFPKLATLDLDNCTLRAVPHQSALHCLRCLSGLRSLSIARCTAAQGALTALDCVEIGAMTKLSSLRISEVKIAPDVFAYVARLHQLKELTLSWINITVGAPNPVDYAHLTALSNLQYLDLSNTQPTYMSDLKSLSCLQQLSELRLRRTATFDANAVDTLRALTSLRRLDATHCGLANPQLFQLSCATQLQGLILKRNAFDNRALHLLAGLTQLTQLDMSYCPRINYSQLDALSSLTALCRKPTPFPPPDLRDSLDRGMDFLRGLKMEPYLEHSNNAPRAIPRVLKPVSSCHEDSAPRVATPEAGGAAATGRSTWTAQRVTQCTVPAANAGLEHVRHTLEPRGNKRSRPDE